MHARHNHRFLPVLMIALAVVLPAFGSGCGDETRTTGSQVEISEEAKAQIEDMRNMYKEQGIHRKGKGQVKKKAATDKPQVSKESPKAE